MTSSPANKAYFYLIKILSARDYSEYKLREKLREKKYSSEEIEQAINEVKSKGYLREENYAAARVKAFMEKGYSPVFIRQKLAQENVTLSDEKIEAVFTEYRLTPNDQIERLIRKKIRGKAEIDYNEESKILRYLISKGHDFSESKKLIKVLLKESSQQFS